MPSFADSAMELGDGEANKKKSIENSFLTHVELEIKAEAHVDAEVESWPRECKQSDGNDTSKRNVAKKQVLNENEFSDIKITVWKISDLREH